MEFAPPLNAIKTLGIRRRDVFSEGLRSLTVRISIQLRTTKVEKLNTSGTRLFGANLTTDLKPDGQKELKNGVFLLFPRVFG